MWKRIVAAIIDFFLIVMPLFIVCIIVLKQVGGEKINSQVIPIVAFQLVLSPIGIIQHVMEYPLSLGITIEQFVISLFVVFACEVIIYSAFEVSPMKRTIGKVLIHIEYEHNLTLWQALLRNALKVLSRYLLGTPLVFVLFSKKGYALHDVLIHNSVIKSK